MIYKLPDPAWAEKQNRTHVPDVTIELDAGESPREIAVRIACAAIESAPAVRGWGIIHPEVCVPRAVLEEDIRALKKSAEAGRISIDYWKGRPVKLELWIQNGRLFVSLNVWADRLDTNEQNTIPAEAVIKLDQVLKKASGSLVVYPVVMNHNRSLVDIARAAKFTYYRMGETEEAERRLEFWDKERVRREGHSNVTIEVESLDEFRDEYQKKIGVLMDQMKDADDNTRYKQYEKLHYVYEKAVRDEIERLGFRPASIEEFFCFGEAYEEAFRSSIVCIARRITLLSGETGCICLYLDVVKLLLDTPPYSLGSSAGNNPIAVVRV